MTPARLPQVAGWFAEPAGGPGALRLCRVKNKFGMERCDGRARRKGVEMSLMTQWARAGLGVLPAFGEYSYLLNTLIDCYAIAKGGMAGGLGTGTVTG